MAGYVCIHCKEEYKTEKGLHSAQFSKNDPGHYVCYKCTDGNTSKAIELLKTHRDSHKMEKKPLTLNELEQQLKKCRELGATGEEPIFLEGTVVTGVEGLKISTRTRAYNAALCDPLTMNIGQIINIWGIPYND
jgi:hypothetical protein